MLALPLGVNLIVNCKPSLPIPSHSKAPAVLPACDCVHAAQHAREEQLWPAGVHDPSPVTAHLAFTLVLLRADSTTTISLAFISKLGTLEVAAASLATSTYWVRRLPISGSLSCL